MFKLKKTQFLIGIFFLATWWWPGQLLAIDDDFTVQLSVSGITAPAEVMGCTNPAASNFNSLATQDDGSCVIIGVPNVTNLVASVSSSTINLSWQNPVFVGFDVVRVVRKTGSVPANPTDGQLVYEGTAEQLADTSIVFDTTYNYVVFVRNLSGQYSSGALVQAAIITIIEPPIEPPVEPPVEPPSEPPSEPPVGGASDPFSSFPDSFTQLPEDFSIIISQRSLGSKKVKDGGSIRLSGNEEVTIFIPYESVPAVLKTIGLTLFDPTDPRKSFSFLLRVNDDKTGYEATLSPLGRGGVYNFTLHIINYQDQSIKRVRGSLVVAGVAEISAATIGRAASEVALGVGVAAGAVQLVTITTNAKSLVDIYLIILRGIAALMGYLGLRRRNQPWGTVYDAVTKQPIDPAVVSVTQNGQEITSAITDIDGRYGFFLQPGTYVLTAGKTHYKFPSTTLAGKTNDELYGNLYFGEPINASGEEVINRNIPLDPVGFDWNEFAKNKSNFFKLYSRRELLKNSIFNILYVVGFVVALTHALLSPTWLDFFILFFYLILFGAKTFWHFRYPVRSLHYAGTREPLPFSIIRIFLAEVDQEIKKIVTDKLGRFYLLVRPGTYYYTVEEKTLDGTYKQIYRSTPIELKRGVLNTDIVVPHNTPTV